jgi:hypothetical protein
MIGYRVRRFLEVWAEEDRTTRVFLAWNAANTWVALVLLVGSVGLLAVMSAAGFQRAILLSYIAVAVAWLVSVFVIGPAYDRAVAPDETASDE